MIYNLGRVVPLFKGTYDAATTYGFLDVVFYDNSSFVALDTTTGNLPTDTTHWLPVALKGTTQNPTEEQIATIISTVETYITTNTIVDNLNSTDTDKSLAANQGKELFEMIDSFRLYGNDNTLVRHRGTPVKQNHKYRISLMYPNIDTTGVSSTNLFYVLLSTDKNGDNPVYTYSPMNLVPSTYTIIPSCDGFLRISMRATAGAMQIITIEDITETDDIISKSSFLDGVDYTCVVPTYTIVDGYSINGDTGSPVGEEGYAYAKLNVSGYDRITFLGYRTSSSETSTSGYAFYSSDTIGTSSYVSGSHWLRPSTETNRIAKYTVDIPPTATWFATICLMANNKINQSNFYIRLEKGNKIGDTFASNSTIDSKISELNINTESDSVNDLSIKDDYDNILVEFKNGHIKTKNFDSENISVSAIKSIKLLMIGNSFSLDNIAYIPWLLNDVDDTIDYEFGVAKISGASLQTQYNAISSNSASYDFYHIKKGQNAWVLESSKTFSYIQAYADWGVITLQQNSTNSPVFSTYQPYLDDIIDILFSYGKNYKLGWLLTQASADYSGRFPDSTIDPNGDYQTSDDMYNGIASCVQQVLATTPVSFVSPAGTAIQNARQNATLDAIGNFAPTGHSEANGQLTYDGYHLQEGLPSITSAYATLLTILDLFSKDKGIFGNTIRPTDTWRSGKNIPGAHGTSVGVNDSNIRVAQKCALIAMNNPFEITENID